ncbi:FMN reductase (NADPH) [compost metagenome]
MLAALKAQEVLHGVFADDSQVVLRDEEISLSDGVATRLEEALESFYLALGRRKPPRAKHSPSLFARQTA